MGVIGLRVPGAITYRHLAIRLVSTACKMALDDQVASDAQGTQGTQTARFDRDFEPEVVSAVGEAFNNIAVHGFRDLEPGPVQIEVDWDDEKLAITMIDSGRTYDPSTVVAPDLAALPESGMGLFIMTSCMDVVDYRAGPPNVLRLVKNRRREGVLPAPSPESASPRDEAGGVDVSAATSSDADPESAGDRRSGVEIIGTGEAGPADQGSTRTPAESNWRMKAVGADPRTGDGARRT